MKTIQIIGDSLHENLLVAITSGINNPALSFAINVKFIEYEKITEAKLVLHTKEILRQESFDKGILSFTGTIVTEQSSRPCMGCYYTDGLIKECYLTIIAPETTIFESNISKEEFIQLTKTYCQSRKMETSEDGNLTKGFHLFENLPKAGDPTGTLRCRKDSGIEIQTVMYKNLFPMFKNYAVVFGEFIDEHTIKVCSTNEALLRGVTIC